MERTKKFFQRRNHSIVPSSVQVALPPSHSSSPNLPFDTESGAALSTSLSRSIFRRPKPVRSKPDPPANFINRLPSELIEYILQLAIKEVSVQVASLGTAKRALLLSTSMVSRQWRDESLRLLMGEIEIDKDDRGQALLRSGLLDQWRVNHLRLSAPGGDRLESKLQSGTAERILEKVKGVRQMELVGFFSCNSHSTTLSFSSLCGSSMTELLSLKLSSIQFHDNLAVVPIIPFALNTLVLHNVNENIHASLEHPGIGRDFAFTNRWSPLIPLFLPSQHTLSSITLYRQDHTESLMTVLNACTEVKNVVLRCTLDQLEIFLRSTTIKIRQFEVFVDGGHYKDGFIYVFSSALELETFSNLVAMTIKLQKREDAFEEPSGAADLRSKCYHRDVTYCLEFVEE